MRAAHLGPDAHSPSPHSLRRAGRRLRPRPHPLGATCTPRFLPTQVCTERGVPGKVHGRLEVPIPPEETCLSWLTVLVGGTPLVRALPAHTPPTQMGGRCEEALRWTGARAALPGPLHSPCGHLQPPAYRHGGWQGYLPLERLCSQRPETQNDAGGRRVH